MPLRPPETLPTARASEREPSDRETDSAETIDNLTPAPEPAAPSIQRQPITEMPLRPPETLPSAKAGAAEPTQGAAGEQPESMAESMEDAEESETEVGQKREPEQRQPDQGMPLRLSPTPPAQEQHVANDEAAVDLNKDIQAKAAAGSSLPLTAPLSPGDLTGSKAVVQMAVLPQARGESGSANCKGFANGKGFVEDKGFAKSKETGMNNVEPLKAEPSLPNKTRTDASPQSAESPALPLAAPTRIETPAPPHDTVTGFGR